MEAGYNDILAEERRSAKVGGYTNVALLGMRYIGVNDVLAEDRCGAKVGGYAMFPAEKQEDKKGNGKRISSGLQPGILADQALDRQYLNCVLTHEAAYLLVSQVMKFLVAKFIGNEVSVCRQIKVLFLSLLGRCRDVGSRSAKCNEDGVRSHENSVR
eukprot:1158320-Pelagomonas_calceolata.AAC.2